MDGAVLAEPVMERLRKRNPAYHDTAYLFILAALHHTIERAGETRHIAGRELAEGCRDLALERFGLMSRTVLEHWGIRATRDLGEIVFALVDCGVLVKQEGDDPADFDDVYCFSETFESHYPWCCPRKITSALRT
jgi:uncharacterized repeat protein (TIGR04138 family)